MSKTFKFLVWSGKKAVVFLALTVALSLAVVGTTIAYIIDYTESLKNTFTPPVVDISIDGDDIKNVGDTDVYVRAAVIINWVNTTDGTTLAATPVVDTDYSVVFNTAGGWVKGSDGFWYYAEGPLAVGATADSLISSVTELKPLTGYKLTVQIVSSAIQATPANAITESWTSVTGIDGEGKLIITP